MRFVEIENNIINIDCIQGLQLSKLTNGEYRCCINFSNGEYDSVDSIYYNKLKELIKPIHLTDDRKYIDVNDFPGDNMIEE